MSAGLTHAPRIAGLAGALGVALVGCATDDELGAGRSAVAVDATPADLAASCKPVTLVAYKSHLPTRWRDATAAPDPALSFAQPASIAVTLGNAGNHATSFSFSLDGVVTTCVYRGSGKLATPIAPADVAAAMRYDYEACEPAATPGSEQRADWLRLHVSQGGNSIYPGQRTQVKLELVPLAGCCDSTDPPIFYPDDDGDGFGDGAEPLASCAPPPDYVANPDDCDDRDPAVNPAAREVCNGADDDCDGLADDGISTTPWFRDRDRDGFGDPADSRAACARPAGFVANAGDCNDRDPAVNPAARELVADGIDQDCDGLERCFRDGDGDGVGTPATILDTDLVCTNSTAPTSHRSDDCDDTRVSVFPGAPELPGDGADQDCDAVDRCFVDLDRDGFGGAATVVDDDLDCDNGGPRTSRPGDCNDATAAVNPYAAEICNGADDDCDGAIDDGVASYRDADTDGFGDPSQPRLGCPIQSGFVDNDLDCNDAVDSIRPGAAELCNGGDDDCDGSLDEAPIDGVEFFEDADGDGFGNPDAAVLACTQPPGTDLDDADCDDTRADVNPSAPERCNGADDDCDGAIDEGC